ncbi:hypothetical protein T492DRAFT_987870 [Pavlovales sp. CCMP2436]|nr:hypothetical protein T492DRAFT_987870 [Pavlovales sp. CCMP2436]
MGSFWSFSPGAPVAPNAQDGRESSGEAEMLDEETLRRHEGATVVQAAMRGHMARKDSRLANARGEVLMRTNLPNGKQQAAPAARALCPLSLLALTALKLPVPTLLKGWRAAHGVPPGFEFEQRRFLSFLDNHLVVSTKVRWLAPSATALGTQRRTRSWA